MIEVYTLKGRLNDASNDLKVDIKPLPPFGQSQGSLNRARSTVYSKASSRTKGRAPIKGVFQQEPAYQDYNYSSAQSSFKTIDFFTHRIQNRQKAGSRLDYGPQSVV